MDTAIASYSYACGFMNAALSTFDYLQEECFSHSIIDDGNITTDRERWWSTAGWLAEWCIVSQTDLHLRAPISKVEAMDIYFQMERLGDDMIFGWSRTLLNLARGSISRISHDLALYLGYCEGLAQAVELFDEISMDSARNYPELLRYHSKHRKEWLELLRVREHIEQISSSVFPSFKKALKETGRVLRNQWHLAVKNPSP